MKTVEALILNKPDLLFIEMVKGIPQEEFLCRAVSQVRAKVGEYNFPPVFIGFTTRLTRYTKENILKNLENVKLHDSGGLLKLDYDIKAKTDLNPEEHLCLRSLMTDDSVKFTESQIVEKYFTWLGFIPTGINIMHTKPEAIYQSLNISNIYLLDLALAK